MSNSISILLEIVAIYCVGFMIFTSESNTKQLAVIIPGPLAIILPEKGSFSAVFKIICFRFNKISNTCWMFSWFEENAGYITQAIQKSNK